MKLSEVFQQLAYGELSQLNLGTITDEELPESAHAPLLAHVNLGLTALYKRFNLKQGRITFALNPAGSTYQIGASDLHKIERVLTDAGKDLPLNDGNDKYSCFTSKMDTLRIHPDVNVKLDSIPEQYKTDKITVLYRANHPKIVATGGFLVPESVELELPYSHLEALLYFVASRAHNPIGMVNEFNAGNNWAAKYEMECQRLENLNLEIDEANENFRLYEKGWV